MLVDQLIAASQRLHLVFAVHPRTRARLREFGLISSLEEEEGIQLIEPLGYIDFMNLVTNSALVITDSGGLQEETTYLNIPCLTLRDNTERPITITHGSNRLTRPDDLLKAVDHAMSGQLSIQEPPELWDGHTACRVVESLHRHMQ
jgi:UDP-N-acetylglucosamine 2-epimerase (non-hydrolysing)